ncbi:MAG: hypothetical protein ACTHN4_01700 [Sphingomicrobium sp.]
MQFLWATLIAMTGRDLEQLRTQSLAQLRDSAAQGQAALRSTDTQQSTVRPAVRSVLQLASMLEATGHRDEGLNLLEQQLAKMPLKPNGWSGIEWFSVASAHATLRWHAGDYPDAIAEYSTIEQALSGSPYLLNATVNRAALLAESGHYQDALTTIDGAWAEFLAQTKGDKVPGSERQFAWIRACALNGLGRTDEARREMRILVEDRAPTDPDFVIPKDNDIELRAAVCMNDAETVTNLILRDLTGSPVGSKAVVWMQPAFQTPLPAWQAMFDKVRADKRVQDAVAERMRVLPPELTPALNGWANAGDGSKVSPR